LRFFAVGDGALLLLLQSFFAAHEVSPFLMLMTRQPLLRMLFTLRLQILLGFSLLLMKFRDEMPCHLPPRSRLRHTLVSPGKLINPLENSAENKNTASAINLPDCISLCYFELFQS
jgi:hypothetical protein